MSNINDNLAVSLSQSSQILIYLRLGNRLTSMEALKKFGCFRLASRVSDLKARGEKIEKQTVIRNGKRVAQYYLNTQDYE